MPTIMPQSELVRKAVSFIEAEFGLGKQMNVLLDDAAMRFNLSPKEDEMLRDFFRSDSSAAPSGDEVISSLAGSSK